MNGKILLNLLTVLISIRTCKSHACPSLPSPTSSFSSSLCLSFFKVSTCPCVGSCNPVQLISHDVDTLKSLILKIEQKDPSSCLYFNDTAIKYPPKCCSFPFTLNGRLYLECVPRNATSAPGCFLSGGIWVECSNPNDKIELTNDTLTALTTPLPVQSVSGWIVFQQRLNGAESFNRLWKDYESGFGDPAVNFWLGLEKIYQVCNRGNCQLRLEAYSSAITSWVSVEYSIFFLAPSYENYAIHHALCSGDEVPYFSSRNNSNGVINGMRFTTTDADLDTRPAENCAVVWSGGWWYNNCFWYNFNGVYGSMGFSLANGNYLLDSSRMMMKLA